MSRFRTRKLEDIDVSGWDTSSVKSASEMFARMDSLRSLAIDDGWTINLAETSLDARRPGEDGDDVSLSSIVVYDAAGSSASLKDAPLDVAATYYLDSHYVPKP